MAKEREKIKLTCSKCATEFWRKKKDVRKSGNHYCSQGCLHKKSDKEKKPKVPHTKREDLIKQFRDYYYNLFLQNIGKRPKELVDVFGLCANSIFRWHRRLLVAGYKLPLLPGRDKSYWGKIEKKTKKVKYHNTKPLNSGQARKLDDPKPTKVKDFSTGYRYVRIDSKTFKLQKTA